ncbi:MAG: hypothetical protein ACREA4_08070, partial [Nitrososphaera sp.]
CCTTTAVIDSQATLIAANYKHLWILHTACSLNTRLESSALATLNKHTAADIRFAALLCTLITPRGASTLVLSFTAAKPVSAVNVYSITTIVVSCCTGWAARHRITWKRRMDICSRCVGIVRIIVRRIVVTIVADGATSLNAGKRAITICINVGNVAPAGTWFGFLVIGWTAVITIWRSISVGVCIRISTATDSGGGFVGIGWTAVITICRLISVGVCIRISTETLSWLYLIRVIRAAVEIAAHSVAVRIIARIVGAVIFAVDDSIAIGIHTCTGTIPMAQVIRDGLATNDDSLRIIRSIGRKMAQSHFVGTLSLRLQDGLRDNIRCKSNRHQNHKGKDFRLF